MDAVTSWFHVLRVRKLIFSWTRMVQALQGRTLGLEIEVTRQIMRINTKQQTLSSHGSLSSTDPKLVLTVQLNV